MELSLNRILGSIVPTPCIQGASLDAENQEGHRDVQ